MKIAKMLSPETDTEALAKRAFMHLPGVTDEWIKTLEVEKIAGAQVSLDEDFRLIAELIQKDRGDSCCRMQTALEIQSERQGISATPRPPKRNVRLLKSAGQNQIS
jgi:hypothetical protein